MDAAGCLLRFARRAQKTFHFPLKNGWGRWIFNDRPSIVVDEIKSNISVERSQLFSLFCFVSIPRRELHFRNSQRRRLSLLTSPIRSIFVFDRNRLMRSCLRIAWWGLWLKSEGWEKISQESWQGMSSWQTPAFRDDKLVTSGKHSCRRCLHDLTPEFQIDLFDFTTTL